MIVMLIAGIVIVSCVFFFASYFFIGVPKDKRRHPREVAISSAALAFVGIILIIAGANRNAPADPVKEEQSGTFSIDPNDCTHEMEIIKRVDPTCTESGLETSICKKCGYKQLKNLPATKHDDIVLSKTDATCTESGKQKLECKVCGYVREEIIPPKGHKFETISKTEATCSSQGEEVKKCTVCGEETTTIIYTGDHVWKPADCEHPKTCELCGETSGEPLGHEGYYTCSRCGKSLIEPIVFSGTGNQVIQNVNLSGGFIKVTSTHNGSRNFIAAVYDSEGNRVSGIVNEIGVYNGTKVFDDRIENGFIEVQADGAWSFTFEVISGTATSNLTSDHDVVSGYFLLSSGAHVVKLNHTGKHNFIVHVIDEEGNIDSLINEIGEFSGEKLFSVSKSKRYFVEVIADGTWTIDFDEGAKQTYVE